MPKNTVKHWDDAKKVHVKFADAITNVRSAIAAGTTKEARISAVAKAFADNIAKTSSADMAAGIQSVIEHKEIILDSIEHGIVK